MSNAEKLEQIYFKWLQQEYSFTDIDDNYISISTPFIDSNYDNIELFASILGDQIILSDFGYTIFNLKAKGIDVTPVQKNKWRLLQQVLIDFGVKINPSTMTLSIETTLHAFPSAKNRLLQAVMRINDIEYLSKSNTKKSFNDTISAYFTKQEIWATKSIDISNNDGIHSHFDFAIQNNDGERLVKTAARPNDINQAKIFNYDVNAVSPVRTAKFFLLINDQQNAIDDAIAPAALASLNRSKTKVIGYREILEDNKYLVNK